MGTCVEIFASTSTPSTRRLRPSLADLCETRLRSINKFAPIVRSTKSEVSPDQVLGIGAFDLKRTLEMDPEFLDTEGEHEHDNTVSSIGINIEGDVDPTVVI